MYDEYDDGSEGGASIGRKVALVLGVVAIAAAGFFAFKAVTKDSGGEAVGPGASTEATVASTAPDSDDSPTTTGKSDGVSDATETTSAPDDSAAATSTTEAARAVTQTAAPTTVAPASTAAPTTVPPPPPTQAPFVTQPDGTPAWVIALYDTDKITITGAVPDEAAKQRLQDLAVANAKPGQAATVDNRVTINPSVPRGVGVRVVELTSVRFPEGSAEVGLEHAAELNRVVTIMNALPNITALVIGHADQRGDDVSNYVLSESRADSVTGYLASQGVSPARMSSRAVGEADLLTLDNNDTALALNRRTEFVFFGLLQP